MPQIKTAVFPVHRKTNNFYQWRGYIESQLKELRGLEKHSKNRIKEEK